MGWTFDGVCANFSGKFCELANRRYGTDFIELDQQEWNFKPWFTGAQVDEVWERDIKPTKNFWMTLRPLEGTQQLEHIPFGNGPSLLGNLKKAELFFITSRVETAGMTAREQTCHWLRNWFHVTYPTVIVVDDPKHKVPIAQALKLDCFIDDKAATVRAMHEGGIRSYLKMSPYNCRESYPEGVIPVEFLNEYLESELEVKHG